MNKQDLIKKLKEIEIIHKEKVTLRSGTTSDYYCDIKKAYGHSDILSALAEEVGKILPSQTTCIASSGYGGLPLGAVVSSKLGKKFTAVRSSTKDHGKAGTIAGYVPTQGDNVVIIDDVLTTGSSIKETYSALENTGANIHSAIVVVKRGEPNLPLPYFCILEIEELLPRDLK